MPNLYGDILSDVAAQIAGSVGLAGSANIGEHVAMFEAIHGSAPRRAGQNVANPSGLLLGGVMMLVHLNQVEAAARVHNAWLKTLEDGIHTYDIYADGVSKHKVGTTEFADSVIERLGQLPQRLPAVSYGQTPVQPIVKSDVQPNAKKELVGVDVFLHHSHRNPNQLGEHLQKIKVEGLGLAMITNRGVKVWPGGMPETFCTDHWRCRFLFENGMGGTHGQVLTLLHSIHQAGFDFIKTEHLCTFDGQPGFSLGQGQ